MTLKKLTISVTLKTLFIILFGFTCYFSIDVIANLNSGSDIQQKNVHTKAEALLQTLQSKLQTMQLAINQYVIEHTNKTTSADNNAEKLGQELAIQLHDHPLVSQFSFVTAAGQSYSYPSKASINTVTSGDICLSNSASPHPLWQSKIAFKPDNKSLLKYHYRPYNQDLFLCIVLTIEVNDIITSFYDYRLNSLYHIITDNQNRIAYHPNDQFINKLSNDLLILEPLMTLLNNRLNTSQSIASNWQIRSHISEMDQGHWKVATLTDNLQEQNKVNTEQMINTKQQVMNKLSQQINQIKLMLNTLTDQTDANTLLATLNQQLNSQPLADEFYFALSDAPSCLFSTKSQFSESLQCHTDNHTSDSQSDHTSDQWQVTTGHATLSYQFTAKSTVKGTTSAANKTLQTIGFAISFDKIIATLSRSVATPAYHFILDRDNLLANTQDAIGTDGLLTRGPILSFIAKPDKTSSQTPDITPYRQLAKPDTKHKAGYLIKQSTGQSLWLHDQAMDKGSWHIATVVETEVDFASIKAKNKTLLLFVITALATLVIYSLLILRVKDGETKEYWHLVKTFSVLSVIAIGMIWSIKLSMPHPNENSEYQLKDKTGLAHAIAQKKHQYQTSLVHSNIADIPAISLGLRVDSMSINDGGVNLIGLVWLKNTDCLTSAQQGQQKQSSTCPALEDIELEFPEAEQIELTPHITQPNNLVKRFSLQVDFSIDSSIYPFERGVIPLRITTAGYNNPYRLVPDFNAYGMMNPSTKPGLSEKLSLKGWRLHQSYFSFQPWLNTAKYSQGNALYDGELMELYFNIEVGRKFLNPFIADMVPIIVITALLFLVLMTMTKNEQHMNELGFNASTVLGYCSGLFFVLIVAHVYLREKLNIDSIAYIELFYFMMYFVILSISASAILFSSRFEQPFMAYEDGVVVKILFWPVIFFITLVFTFMTFY